MSALEAGYWRMVFPVRRNHSLDRGGSIPAGSYTDKTNKKKVLEIRLRRTTRQRCKKRQIWQIYLCYFFQGGANFLTMLGLCYQHCGHSTDRKIISIQQYNNIISPTENLNNWIGASLQTMLNIIATLINVMKYLLIDILQNSFLL